MKPSIREPDIAMVNYLIDCTLATVDDLAMKKSRSKSEFARQKAIAQCGIDWVIAKGEKPTGRAADVVNKHNGSVNDYAQEIVDYWSKGR